MVSRPPDEPFDDPMRALEALLGEISQRISPHQFETWFRNLPMRFQAPNRIVVTAQNRFSRTWIDRKFREVIALAGRTVMGMNVQVEIIVAEGVGSNGETLGGTPLAPDRQREVEPSECSEDGPGAGLPRGLVPLDGASPTGSPSPTGAPFPTGTPGRAGLPARESSPPAHWTGRHPVRPERTAERGDGATLPAAGRVTPASPFPTAPLHRDFTFASFVIGPSNRFAHAAALGVAEAPGRTYNPVFIYGGVGLGKTHLLHAIVHRLEEQPGRSITYLTSETFINHLTQAREAGEIEKFRRALRGTDVLIIDDIQFIAGKERTQEEFFHTFNALISEGKQVVVSSDSPPREIAGLKERLVSRFKMGLVTRIDAPTFDMRVAILHKKAHARGRDLPQNVADLIANHIATNIRELEGAITRLFSLASLAEGPMGSPPPPITPELARAALKEIALEDGPGGAIGIPEIQKAVSLFYDVKQADLASKRRARTIVFARQVCMYLTRKLTHYSLQEIGKGLGGKDHTTVLYSIDKIEQLILKDPRVKADLEAITSRILATRSAL